MIFRLETRSFLETERSIKEMDLGNCTPAEAETLVQKGVASWEGPKLLLLPRKIHEGLLHALKYYGTYDCGASHYNHRLRTSYLAHAHEIVHTSRTLEEIQEAVQVIHAKKMDSTSNFPSFPKRLEESRIPFYEEAHQLAKANNTDAYQPVTASYTGCQVEEGDLEENANPPQIPYRFFHRAKQGLTTLPDKTQHPNHTTETDETSR